MIELAEAIDTENNADVLRIALVAVAELHSPMTAQRHYGDRRLCCKTCDDGRSTPRWPCETREAMAGGLGSLAT